MVKGAVIAVLLVFGASFYTSKNSVDKVRLLKAFNMVEASGKFPKKPYWDVNAMRWGGYAFGVDRWVECGGKRSQWGKAPPDVQTRVMLNAIEHYLSTKPAHVDPIVWCATFHNVGHGVNKETSYVKKLRNAYMKAKPRSQ